MYLTFGNPCYTSSWIHVPFSSISIPGWWFGTFFIPFSWECHHPNCYSMFQRGRSSTKQIMCGCPAGELNETGILAKWNKENPGRSELPWSKDWWNLCLYNIDKHYKLYVYIYTSYKWCLFCLFFIMLYVVLYVEYYSFEFVCDMLLNIVMVYW